MLAQISRNKKIAIMIAVMLGILLSALDQTIIGTAMPRIVQELHGLEHLSWVFTAYMLASTIAVPIYGKLSDIYGRKNFYLLGIFIFLIGSALSGLSQNMEQLIAFRAFQGIGGGAIMANSLAIIADIFPPSERGRWQGMMGGIFGVAAVIGPTLGGWLTDNISWRWNFYINVPIGILTLAVLWLVMPKIVTKVKDRVIDYAGGIFLSTTLVPLLLGFVWGGTQYPWASWQIVSLFIASMVSLVIFTLVESKAKEPILPLDLFKNSIFTTSAVITFLTAFGMFGAIVYIPLFAQLVTGVSATNSGVILTPMMIGLVITSAVSGQIVSKTGRYKLSALVGLAITTVALYLLSKMNIDTSNSELTRNMIILGGGLGITMPIFVVAVQNIVSHEKIGVATAATQLFRSLGSTIGVAIMGTVLNNSLSENLKQVATSPKFATLSRTFPNLDITSLDSNKLQAVISPQVMEEIQTKLAQLPPYQAQQIRIVLDNFLAQLKIAIANSVSQIFIIGTFVLGFSILVALFLKEIPLRKSHDERPTIEEAGVQFALEEGEFPAQNETTGIEKD